MKYLYIIFICLVLLFHYKPVIASLPLGATAPDWTLTDLNGNTHQLYNILSSGKHVIIQFSASWSSMCWNYHNTQRLQSVWENYGPGGTDEVMVFFVEADLTTNEACLYGGSACVGGTVGNWTQNISYPVIHLTTKNGGNLASNYQLTAFPTMYAIRAQDKKTFVVGQPTAEGWESWFMTSFEMNHLKKSQNIAKNNPRRTISIQTFNTLKAELISEKSDHSYNLKTSLFKANHTTINKFADVPSKYDYENNQDAIQTQIFNSFKEGDFFDKKGHASITFLSSKYIAHLKNYLDSDKLINVHVDIQSIATTDIQLEIKTNHLSTFTEEVKHSSAGVKDLTFSLYPNPASGMIHVNFDSDRETKAELSIFSESGKMYYTSRLDGKKEHDIDLSEVRNGVYFMKIKEGSLTKVKKFIVLE